MSPEDMAAIRQAVKTIRPVIGALESVSVSVDPEAMDRAARAVKLARPALDEAQRILSNGETAPLFGTRIRDALEAFRR